MMRKGLILLIAPFVFLISTSLTPIKSFFPLFSSDLTGVCTSGMLELSSESTDDNWHVTLQADSISFGASSYSFNGKVTSEHNGNLTRFYHQGDFIEEYVQSSAGIRQNFIIQTPASQPASEISVHIRISGDLHAKQLHSSEVGFFRKKWQTSGSVFSYSDLKAWDARGKLLPARMELSGNHLTLVVNAGDAIYPVTIDPISSSTYTSLERDQAGMLFGGSVSSAGDVNGDGYSDIVVGASNYSNGQSGEGAFYIYHGSSTGINTTLAFSVESNQASANMGNSVSTAGDVNGDGYSDIVVGAYQYDNGQTDEGVVFVYYGSDTGLSSSNYDQLELNQASAKFGYSVACAGDVNGDGYSDLVIGASEFDNGQTDEGVVVIYHGSSSGISSSYNQLLELNQASCYFGYSVAGAGDVNGDGYSDVIAGAPNYDGTQTDEGVVNIYHGGSGGISASAAQSIVRGQASSNLGVSVSTAGDVNGDGYSDIILGANLYDGGQTDEGVAFVHHGSSGGVSSSLAANMEVNQASGEFAFSVACAGDVNGDGYSDVVVGGIKWDNGQTDEGVVNVYLGSSSGVSTSAFASLEKDQAGAEFGNSVASAGDVNGDGYSDIIVGSPQYDGGQTDEGVAFIYTGEVGKLSSSAFDAVYGPDYHVYCGIHVSPLGDYNGDGYDDIGVSPAQSLTVQIYKGPNLANISTGYSIGPLGGRFCSAGDVDGDGIIDLIASYYYNNSGKGKVGIYTDTLNTLQQFFSPVNGSQTSMYYGYSISPAGDVNRDGYADIIVGSSREDNGQTDEGIVYVYYGSHGGLSSSNRSRLEVDAAGAQLGYIVSSAGDVNGDGYNDVVCGAPYYDNGNTDEGLATVFYGSDTGLVSTARTDLEINEDTAYFGRSVASAGDVNGDGYDDIIVGSDKYSQGTTNQGRIDLFLGSSSGISTSPHATLKSGKSGAYYGCSVASAGDVNGDGYSDVVVGAHSYACTNCGRAIVYYGSSSGLDTLSADTLNSVVYTDKAGSWVSSAGDVNGDGLSDVLVGAPNMINPNTQPPTYKFSGSAEVWYGGGRTGMYNRLVLYDSNLTTRIDSTNRKETKFGVGLKSKHFLGRGKGRMAWEVRTNGSPFSSASPITNSTSYTDISDTLTDLGLSGTELKEKVTKSGIYNKVRVRIQYDPVTALTGQVYGPWRYDAMATTGLIGSGVPLPVELLDFEAFVLPGDVPRVELKWQTASETGSDHFVIERSPDTKNWVEVTPISAAGNSQVLRIYNAIDYEPFWGVSYYRLKQIDHDGTEHLSRTQSVRIVANPKQSIYPNPSTGILYLDLPGERIRHVQVFDLQGRKQLFSSPDADNHVQLDISELRNGIYLVVIQTDAESITEKVLLAK